MTAEIVQFVPRPNPSRLTLLETEAVKEAIAAPPGDDTSPCEYIADSGDCA